MVKPKVFLIDATAFCYRAFYALKGLSTSFGQPTNAIYGFINILNKIIKKQKPEFLAACFDVSRDTFRQRKFAEYKIQRPPMPDALSSQIPLIKEIIAAYGIAIFEKPGFEADDIIASLTQKVKEEGLAVTIVSSDKDMLQLIDDNVTVLNPYKEDGLFYDEKTVTASFGVSPRQMVDILALMGDDVDNIPGVPGIGEKTAAELIRNFGSLDKILGNIDKIRQEKIGKAIADNIDKIRLNQELASLKKDVDIEFNLDKLKIASCDTAELFRLFKYLEFKKFLKDLPVPQEKAQDLKLDRLNDTQLRSLLGQGDELILYGSSPDNAVFNIRDKFFQLAEFGINARNILSDPKIMKISHGLKEIKLSWSRSGIALDGPYFDTMVAAYLVNPSKAGYSLADLAWDYLGEHLSDESLNNQRRAALIANLKAKLEQELHQRSLEELFTGLEMPLTEVLADMELNGIELDVEVLKALSRDIEKRLIKLIADIYQISGTQFNINSPKQLRDILFEKLKLPIIKRSKTGPSTDEEVLKSLASRHHLPALLLEYRQLMKLKNTYVDTLPGLIDKETGRIHTSFNQTATETGRLSSTNPNLQNIPVKTDIGRNIRRSIISYNNQSHLLSCDYSQVELRILAHLSKDKFLIQAFKEDKDIHKATAALIYGLGQADITEPMRESAKRVNFGIVYGLTSYGLSRDLGIKLEEAQGFIDSYFLRYPAVKDYIQEQVQRAKEFGYVVTILGRRRYLPEINNKNQAIRQFAERQAINTPIQGSAADLIKLAMIEIHSRLLSKKLETKMILQIHDELVFNVPDKEMDVAVRLIRDRMENVLKLDLPLRVDIKKGKNWLQMEEVS